MLDLTVTQFSAELDLLKHALVLLVTDARLVRRNKGRCSR